MSSFTAVQTSSGIRLSWQTASETENDHFLVYRDDIVIGHINGAGTSSEPHEYEFIDKTAQPGVHRYLLSDVTFGGDETKHVDRTAVIDVDEGLSGPDKFELFDVYPNPFNPVTTVSYELYEDSQIELSLMGTDGKVLRTLSHGSEEKGVHTYPLEMGNMTSGVYLIRLKVGDMIQTSKLILMK